MPLPLETRSWPFCEGEMAAQIRHFGWSNHPLGDPEFWNPALKAAIALVLVQAKPACVCIGESRTLIYNDAYAALLAEKHPDALGKSLTELFTAALLSKALNRAFSGEAFSLKNQFYPFMHVSDEEEIWFDIDYGPLYDDRGNVIAVSLFHTESHGLLDEAALRENELRTQSLFNRAPSFTAILNGQDAIFEYVNEAYYNLVGERKLIGKPLHEALPELAEQGFLELIETVYKTGQIKQGYQVPIRFQDTQTDTPRIRYVDFVCQPIFDRNENITGIFVDGFDVTERKRAEQFSQENELKYRTLFDSIDQGFCIIEMVFDEHNNPVDYIFREMNTQFVEHTGLINAQGKRMRSINPAHEQYWFDIYGRIAREKKPERFENVAQALGMAYEVYAFPVGDESPALVGIMFRNITERKKAQKILENKERKQNFLLRLNDVIQNENDDNAVYNSALDILSREFEPSAAFFSIIQNTDTLIATFESPHNSTHSRAKAFGIPDNLGDALTAQHVLYTADVLEDPRFTQSNRDFYTALQIRSFIAVPVKRDGHTLQMLTLVSDRAGKWSEEDVDIIVETNERTLDVIQRIHMDNALADSEQTLRILTESIPQLVWRSSSQGQWLWTSQQWLDFTGQTLDQALNFGWMECIHPDDISVTLDAWNHAHKNNALNVEHRIRNARDGNYYWFHTRARPIAHANTRHIGWVGTSTEVQHLKELHDRQKIMVAELQHRTRNLIAVVKSIAMQTMAVTETTHDFQEEFSHRLSSLSRVQGLLSHSDDEPITLEGLLRMELDALGVNEETSHQITLSGPRIRLRDSAVQTLALAIHELATNARKYGALSQANGSLSIVWVVKSNLDKKNILSLKWRETGMNAHDNQHNSQRSGYGRELIEKALPYTLGAQTSLTIDENGVECLIDLPLERSTKQ